VAVGPVNLPVTRLFVEEVILECRQKHITRVDILAFEFEMGLFPNVLDEARAKGIDIAPKYIPADVFDKRAVEKNQVVFHDVAAIEVKPHVKKDSVAVELTDFSVFYSQDSIANAETTLKNKASKIVVEKGQIVKVSKDANGIVNREVLTKKWTDWIDYWAVDFNFESKREIVRVKNDSSTGSGQGDEWEERWTGDYIFEHEWQSFRTKKDRSLELTSVFHECEPGRRKLAVKVVDSGKTKVLSLALAWSFYHKLYEPQSELARNFLVITPNIIVLDRIYRDFQGLRIFFDDPVLPDNGFDGRDWRDDFQLTLHRQDEVRITRPTGNIFLTNIHRVYSGDDIAPSPDDEDTRDYFLGKRPTGATTDSKVDLGMIVRDIDELMILNDEAHHIHDPRMAWFKAIEDIHNRLKQKGAALSMQVDTTATPKHNNGAIFVQTVADYPLVEAISQNVVKHPVLPDAASRAKLSERQSAKYTEKYADYIHLGVIEWRKAYTEHEKMGKKAILFVMTDDTRNCDDVAEYLDGHYPDLKDAVLVIHTKSNGDISESATGKDKDELEKLRKQANEIDRMDSPYKAIISVMMLKEGWDVKNVTTIVGLRAYNAPANILPEQTLGRGLRKMYPGDVEEYVSVIGTKAFMEFVESLQAEGVVLERKPMGEGTGPKTPLVVEVDKENEKKDIAALDIEIPVLTPRVYREYKSLSNLDITELGHQHLACLQFSEQEQREIVFKDIVSGEITHTTILDTAGVADYRSVIGYFAQSIMKDLRLVSGYDVLYGKVKAFVQTE